MKAIALIQVGTDLHVCDFEIKDYKDDELEFMDSVKFHFDERVGPENIDPIYVKAGYFRTAKEYDVIDISLTEI